MVMTLYCDLTESEWMAEMYPLSVSTVDIRISDLVRTTI